MGKVTVFEVSKSEHTLECSAKTDAGDVFNDLDLEKVGRCSLRKSFRSDHIGYLSATAHTKKLLPHLAVFPDAVADGCF